MPPLQQKYHKRLPGAFHQLPAEEHPAALIHNKGGILKIRRVLQIDNHAAPAHKEARVLAQRRNEAFERQTGDQRLFSRGVL